MRTVLVVLCLLCVSLQAGEPKSYVVESENPFPGVVPLKQETIWQSCTQKAKPLIKLPYLFIAKTEVSNWQYQEFIQAQIRKGKDVSKLLQDSTVWCHKMTYCEPFVQYYHSHPAYNHYPVVGVSYEKAMAYCKWLEEHFNGFAGVKGNKLPYKKVIVRLPTEEEWELAARSGSRDKTIIYPWKTDRLRYYGKKKKYKGNFLANFKWGRGGNIGIAYGLYDNADYTAPVEWYFQNEIGLHCMSGNVAEMVAEKGIAKGGSWNDNGFKLRIDQRSTYEDALATVGFRYVIEIVEVNPLYAFKKSKDSNWSSQKVDSKYLDAQLNYIPKGTLYANQRFTKIDNQYKSEMDTISMNSYLIGNTEVTNYQYHLFLSSLSKEDSIKHRPQIENWKTENSYQIFQGQFDNPFYAHYPVVNVSHESAQLYCKWFGDKYNETDKTNYKKVEGVLPTAYQWEYAARGGRRMSPYPWGGPYIRNGKGCILANCNPTRASIVEGYNGKESYLHYPENDTLYYAQDDGLRYLGPVTAYWPNDYGLYNMAGNAAEMIQEKGISRGGSWKSNEYYLHNGTEDNYSKPNPMTGFRVVMKIVEL